MKKGFNILLVITLVAIGLSCNKTPTYTDYLKRERKTIDRIIDENGFDILSDFPKDSIFKENEFVKLPNGLYLNVINKGTGNKAKVGQNILARVKYHLQYSDTMIIVDEFKNDGIIIDFKFGANYANGSIHDQHPAYYLYGAGFNTPLEYFGDSCEVKMIIPFTLGSVYRQQNYNPVYVERIRYVFEK